MFKVETARRSKKIKTITVDVQAASETINLVAMVRSALNGARIGTDCGELCGDMRRLKREREQHPAKGAAIMHFYDVPLPTTFHY